ncbi:hypothetical protein EZV62_004668 [Acer yangbiense]|uniref:Zinc knuckle CX2CX4HX4C domain-containing protein n=1 Tax=Acer yangbiense TaxID=1000413 RepID=A0A5C7IKB4_9ROSI|nr:hypothetical protein EZV62_004668 [Acer yangbiense]
MVLRYDRLPNYCFWCGCLGYCNSDCLETLMNAAVDGKVELSFRAWLRLTCPDKWVSHRGRRNVSRKSEETATSDGSHRSNDADGYNTKIDGNKEVFVESRVCSIGLEEGVKKGNGSCESIKVGPDPNQAICAIEQGRLGLVHNAPNNNQTGSGVCQNQNLGQSMKLGILVGHLNQKRVDGSMWCRTSNVKHDGSSVVTISVLGKRVVNGELQLWNRCESSDVWHEMAKKSKILVDGVDSDT